MEFAVKRNWYASKKGIIYEFETRIHRNHAVENHGFQKVRASEAYDKPRRKVSFDLYDGIMKKDEEKKHGQN